MRRRSIVPPLVKSVIFVVVTGLATALLGLTIANAGAGGVGVEYAARFRDATGLNVGDDVRIAGVRVGEVTDVRVVDHRYAEVRFTVDRDRSLPASVTAAIRYRNLVGQRYLALAQGVGPMGATLPVGGTIPLERTTAALDLTELFNGFQPLFRALSPADVNQLATEIVQVFQGEESTVESLIRHTASLAATLASRDEVIGQLIDNLNQALSTVNSRDNALADLVSTLQELVSGLAADRKPIGDAVTAISQLTDTTAGLLQEVRGPLRADIAALGELADNLNAAEPALEQFLQTLPTKMTTIGRLATYGSWLNFYLCSAVVTGVGVDQNLIPPPTGLPITEARCHS
jgi:phospholipid/cholesterol/gamma-HCH transport system substrate-binding protein